MNIHFHELFRYYQKKPPCLSFKKKMCDVLESISVTTSELKEFESNFG